MPAVVEPEAAVEKDAEREAGVVEKNAPAIASEVAVGGVNKAVVEKNESAVEFNSLAKMLKDPMNSLGLQDNDNILEPKFPKQDMGLEELGAMCVSCFDYTTKSTVYMKVSFFLSSYVLFKKLNELDKNEVVKQLSIFDDSSKTSYTE
ncbi:unnamed protein product [Mucor hiemalis]